MNNLINLSKCFLLTSFIFTNSISAWQLNSQNSAITFEANSRFLKVHGHFKVFTLDKLSFNGKLNSLKGKITITTTSINTKNKKRDRHLREEEFFNCLVHPHATLEVKKVQKASKGGYKAFFVLTIKNKQKEFSIPLNLTVSPKRIMASGNFSINRDDFDISYDSILNPIDKKILLSFKFDIEK